MSATQLGTPSDFADFGPRSRGQLLPGRVGKSYRLRSHARRSCPKAVDSEAKQGSGMKCDSFSLTNIGETLMTISRWTCGIAAVAAPGFAWAGPGVPLGTPVGVTVGATLGQVVGSVVGGPLGTAVGGVLPIGGGLLMVGAGSLALGIWIARRKRKR